MRFGMKAVLGLVFLPIMSCKLLAGDIVDTAVQAGSFKTLAAALEAADLVDTLKSKGPFTVFAPTDEAFAKLPKGTVETLLKPENKGKLQAILTYHVVGGQVLAKDVINLTGATTVNGQRVAVKFDGAKVKLDGAEVIKTDIQCDNGVIHVIDSVLLPSSDSIPAVAEKAGGFKTLLAAVKAAGLAEVLSGDGPFTVFAPTDAAFAKLPRGTVESLLKPENKDKLINILKYHVVSGRVFAEDALAAKAALTLEGSPLRISLVDGAVKINSSKLVKTDINATNGIIHVVDTVLLPSTPGAAASNSVSISEAKRMLEQAVASGAPIYNSGHHGSCADIYQDVMAKLMTSGIDGDGAKLVSHMSATLSKASGQSDTQRAWTLRQGIDSMHTQLSYCKN